MSDLTHAAVGSGEMGSLELPEQAVFHGCVLQGARFDLHLAGLAIEADLPGHNDFTLKLAVLFQFGGVAAMDSGLVGFDDSNDIVLTSKKTPLWGPLQATKSRMEVVRKNFMGQPAVSSAFSHQGGQQHAVSLHFG